MNRSELHFFFASQCHIIRAYSGSFMWMFDQSKAKVPRFYLSSMLEVSDSVTIF